MVSGRRMLPDGERRQQVRRLNADVCCLLNHCTGFHQIFRAVCDTALDGKASWSMRRSIPPLCLHPSTTAHDVLAFCAPGCESTTCRRTCSRRAA